MQTKIASFRAYLQKVASALHFWIWKGSAYLGIVQHLKRLEKRRKTVYRQLSEQLSSCAFVCRAVKKSTVYCTCWMLNYVLPRRPYQKWNIIQHKWFFDESIVSWLIIHTAIVWQLPFPTLLFSKPLFSPLQTTFTYPSMNSSANTPCIIPKWTHRRTYFCFFYKMHRLVCFSYFVY